MSASALAVGAPPATGDRSARWRARLLGVSVFASFFVMVEPSPSDVLVALGLLALLATGLHVPRAGLVLLWMLLALNVGGLFSALPVLHKDHVIVFVLISVFLMAYTIYFFILLADDTTRRLAILRSAWIAAALVAAVLGIMGYFNILGTRDLFTLYASRAKSTFNDPNVFGPYLIFPLLVLAQAVLTSTSRRPVLDTIAVGVLGLGILLSFSRAAWGHLFLSALVLTALLLLVLPTPRARARLMGLGLLAILGLIVTLGAAFTLEEVRAMLLARATLVQDYDVRAGGRFYNLAEAVDIILAYPNGIGPLEFGRRFGEDPHNAYLHTFVAYGWLGGMAYLALVGTTLWIGWRDVFRPTPWRATMVTTVATFTGLAAIGLVIHTDHWRHFFLLVAMIWVMAAAGRRESAHGQWNAAASSAPARALPGRPARA